MITEHTFNSAWFGAPVGIVRDPAWLAGPADDVRAALARYAWVELRCRPDAADRRRLAAHGFFLADTQVHFRLGLGALRPTPSLDGLALRWADAAPFAVAADDMAPFQHERYRLVPGVTPARLAQRYARWAAQLIADAPATCIQVERGGVAQGWFLSATHGKRLQLTLAMTAAGATISGLHLYLAAALGYAGRGHTIGEASFSVHNLPVLNLYSHLGARFVSTEDSWLFVP